MKNKFDPSNNIIQLCLKGMVMEDSGNSEEAIMIIYSFVSLGETT